MNGFVFWPEGSEATLVSLLIRDGAVWLGMRGTKDEVLAVVRIEQEQADGIRDVLNQAFGDEVKD